MCDGSMNVDGNPGDPPARSVRAGADASCAIKAEYWSPMGMNLKYNASGKSMEVKQDNGSKLCFQAKAGSATAERAGVTRKNGALAQMLNADFTPCTSGNPAYVQVVNADGSAQTLNVASGEMMLMRTKTGAVLTKSAYGAKVQVEKDSLGQVKSVWSEKDGLLQLSRTATKLTIQRYAPAKVTRNARGAAAATGLPDKTYSYEWNAATRTMTIINQEAGKAARTRTRQVEGNRVIITEGTDNERIATIYERNELPGGKWEEIKTVCDTNGSGNTLCERTVKKYTDGGWLVLSRTTGYGTALAETTNYAYNDQYRVSVMSRTDGYFTRYEYDQQGRVTLEASPWKDGHYEKVVSTEYADLRFNDNRPAIIREFLLDMNGARTDTKTIRCTYEDSALVNRTTVSTEIMGVPAIVTIEELYGEAEGNEYARGRLRMSQAADGVQKWAFYENTSQYGAARKVTVETRVAGQVVPGRSERTVQYLSAEQTLLRNEKYVHTGAGWSLVSALAYEYDSEKRLIKTTRGNGRSSTREWGCCGPLREADEDGVTLSYGYNSARQLTEVIRSATGTTPEMITSYRRDSSGRVIRTREDIGAMSRTWSRAYDVLGRKTARTDIKGRTTAYAYQNHGLKKVTTLPTGAQEVLEWNRDSSLHYDAPAGKYACTLSYNPGLTDYSIRRHYTDNRIPGYEGNDWCDKPLYAYVAAVNPSLRDQLAAEQQYNEKNQLISLRERGVLTQYEYDALGTLSRVVLPLNSTPTPQNSRITSYAYAYEQRTDGVYHVTTCTTYDAEGRTLTSSRAELVSELSATLESKVISTDIYGKVTTEWTEYDGPTRRKHFITLPTSDITAEVRVTDGFTLYKKDAAGVETTHARTYAAHGCTVSTTDGRGITTSVQYDTADRAALVTDGEGNRTTTVYDPASGQPAVITDALGKTTCYRYDDCGRVAAVYGTAAQPACCQYDEGGNLSRLTTFRVPGGSITTDPTGRTDGDVTQWEYAWQEPLLLRKTYPDSHSTVLAYGTMNRLGTVTNARGVRSTRSYDAATGELLTLAYNDGLTPDVDYRYNHLGWPVNVTDGSGSRDMEYTHQGTLDKEVAMVGGFLRRLQNQYDAYGRLSRYEMIFNSSSLLAATQAYRTDGRLDRAALALGGTEYAYSRQYREGTHLLSGMTLPGGLSQTYAYEEHRDLMTEMKMNRGTTGLLAYTYGYDALARLDARTRAHGSAAQADTFSYNERSELKGATLNGTAYGYAYDNTGNRNTATEAAVAAAYQVNALDQYTQIQRGGGTFLPEYDADGNQTKVQTATGLWTVAYDAENRAVSFTSADGKTLVECGYDSDCRRYSKRVTRNGTVTKNECYLYRGYLQTAALDALHGYAPVHALLWDPAQPQATRPLALVKGGQVYTCAHDQNKNVTALYDSIGASAARYEYTPFGAVTASGTVSCPVQWGSEVYDEELGLVYYNYRYYNPQDGRWLSRDPLGAQSGLNLYAYAGNRMIPDYLGLNTPGATPTPAAPGAPGAPSGDDCPATQPAPAEPSTDTEEDEEEEDEDKEGEDKEKKEKEDKEKKDKEAKEKEKEKQRRAEEKRKAEEVKKRMEEEREEREKNERDWSLWSEASDDGKVRKVMIGGGGKVTDDLELYMQRTEIRSGGKEMQESRFGFKWNFW